MSPPSRTLINLSQMRATAQHTRDRRVRKSHAPDVNITAPTQATMKTISVSWAEPAPSEDNWLPLTRSHKVLCPHPWQQDHASPPLSPRRKCSLPAQGNQVRQDSFHQAVSLDGDCYQLARGTAEGKEGGSPRSTGPGRRSSLGRHQACTPQQLLLRSLSLHTRIPTLNSATGSGVSR